MPRKQANGMGTIVQRKDGRYHAAVYVYTPTGERVRKYVYGKTWQEVHDKRIELLDNNRKGIPSVTSSMKLTDYLDYWLREVARHELRTKTFSDYEALASHYIRPHLGAKRLNALGVGDVRTFLRKVSTQPGRKGRKLSPRTVQYIHAVLRSALQHAVREELIGRNVAKLVSAPSSEEHEVAPMEPRHARRLIEHAQQHWLCALWLVYLATGLRRGEALGLAWSDVNLATGELRVRRTVQRVKGDIVFGEPKTARSRRTLHLPEICVHALKQHRETVAERSLPAQRNPHPHQPADLIFVTRTDRVIDPRSVNRAFGTLLKQAGLEHVRVHDLRHTCATFLKMQGATDREVMEQLGHSSIGVTMNIYAHVLDDTKREMSTRMNQFLGGD
ncbi:site-specific recombinase XerD [Halopolyspora algeriensis]|uniref:Site-specific recombinase XerD n=1 Tax=Halopolyspora algeriensis TaxID=1500506 RepID=A0A368VVL1_9ACTN|nr:tyrosine-type recombinase/integrase [Halopolyspora algeriensis]RCW44688.1 site-specific recombinase XerD [Halopolyspora algeriensis]TQM56046.1 site-specific recombinase XerD [Halopolyspora algeriensis]